MRNLLIKLKIFLDLDGELYKIISAWISNILRHCKFFKKNEKHESKFKIDVFSRNETIVNI